jgi:hypothetical protein
MADYEFAGIAHAEAPDRLDEYHSGVPPLGGGAVLLEAPLGNRHHYSRVKVNNIGEAAVEARLKHQGAVKTVTNENLVALEGSGNRFVGKLQFGAITPESIVLTGDAATIVDDGAGVLHDTGVPANTRGTIDYVTGAIDVTFAGAPTDPTLIDYTHTDHVDFQSSNQTTVKATGGVTPSSGTPFTVQLGFGRVVPGSVTIADGGTLTFADDGKGNIVQTDAGNEADVGSIDYATGFITFVDASGALTGNMTVTYKYNPFAAVLAKAGGVKLLDLFGGSSIPELTSEPWADGIKGESKLSLWGQTTDAAKGSAVKTGWSHFGDDPATVKAVFSAFSAGGESNA